MQSVTLICSEPRGLTARHAMQHAVTSKEWTAPFGYGTKQQMPMLPPTHSGTVPKVP